MNALAGSSLMEAHIKRFCVAQIAAAVQIAAQADADERCKSLLDAREALLFHADALAGLPKLHAGRSWLLMHTLSTAIREIEGCIADERCAVATDHNLWDGIDPEDVPLESVAQMIREHRRAMVSL